MKTSPRDKLILMLLPAVVIGFGWWFWFRPTAQWTELQANVVTARAAVPAAAAVQAQAKKLADLTAQQKELEGAQRADLTKWDELRRRYQANPDHAELTRQLTDLLRRHELTPLTELRVETSSGSSEGLLDKLAERFKRPMQEVIPELAPPKGTGAAAASNGPAAKSIEAELGIQEQKQRLLWRIEFAGRYSDVQAALEELSSSDILVIPVRLSMAEPKADISLRRWTLVVWL